MSSELEKRLRAERATEWLLRLEDAGPTERAEFLKWVKESPRNVREALLSGETQTMFKHLVRDHGIDAFGASRDGALPVDAELARADAEGARTRSTFELASDEAARIAARRSAWRAAAAIAVLSVLALATVVSVEVRADFAVDTGLGEKQTMRLADGTVVHAGSRTRVSVAYTARKRVVRLERGEALFEVRKDPSRPFLVETRLSTVRAVGTAFVVNRVDPEVDVVTVREGIVAVSRRSADEDTATHATFRAGEQIRVKRSTALSVVRVAARKAIASVNGWLEFDQETVEEAVRQFNLRNRAQIRIASREIGHRSVRGAFNAYDPAKFVAFLERQELVSVVDDEPDVFVLVPYGPSRAADDK